MNQHINYIHKKLPETMNKYLLVLVFSLSSIWVTSAQTQFDEGALGAWYMYFWNADLKDSRFGFQGDAQFRNWNVMGDLEQLLLRGGLTYRPNNANVKFTLGYANITTGEYGDGNATVNENRIYQEALIPHKIGNRFFLTHRFRYEQRWVQNQDTRTRYRYNLFVNVALNQDNLAKGAVYLAFYNELFMNGQRSIGDGREVELFDRNRTYMALGYALSDKVRTQLGWMKQITDNWGKGQLQLSLHHSY
jgi:hypothetical protein